MGGLAAAIVGYEIGRSAIYDYIAANNLRPGYYGIKAVLKKIQQETGQVTHYVSTDEPGPAERDKNFAFICCHALTDFGPVECDDLLALHVPGKFGNLVKEMFDLGDAPVKRVFIPYASIFSSSDFV